MWQSGQLRFSHKEVGKPIAGSNPASTTSGNVQQVSLWRNGTLIGLQIQRPKGLPGSTPGFSSLGGQQKAKELCVFHSIRFKVN